VWVFDNRWTLQKGRLHLAFELGGKRIAYAYIRKNGCSTFKRALGFAPDTDIREIEPLHRWSPWRNYDAIIFVWRDPEERLTSLYRNKILERQGADDIIRAYTSSMGEEPSTFEKFAEFALLNADPHCVPQRDHLKPLRYTHAIPLSGLHAAMSEIVGADAAEVFAHNANPSSQANVEISERARALIHNHYFRDYQMIDRLLARR
jgi:hypothetical protein